MLCTAGPLTAHLTVPEVSQGFFILTASCVVNTAELGLLEGDLGPGRWLLKIECQHCPSTDGIPPFRTEPVRTLNSAAFSRASPYFQTVFGFREGTALASRDWNPPIFIKILLKGGSINAKNL